MPGRGRSPARTSLASDVDRFSEELMREAYRTGAGLQAEGHEARIYARWGALFRPSAQARLPTGPPKVRQRLEEFLKVGKVDRAVAPWQDRLRNRLIQSRVELEGQSVPYFTASVRLAEIADRASRRRLFQRCAGVWRSVSEESEAAWASFQEGTHALGYSNGRDAAAELFHYDLPLLARETQRFLTSTEGLYRELLAEEAAREGLAVRELRAYDSSRLLRGIGWAKHFPKQRLPAFLNRALKDLGLPSGSFRPDLAPRPQKNPRAFCAPVRVPDEVYLVLRPVGGHDDYHTALHEMGHALHFGLTDRSLDPTLRRCGDPSLTEGWAFVLDLLFLNPTFRRTLLRGRRFPRFFALTELHLLRRYAGKVAYEADFFRDPLAASLPTRYVRAIEGATLFREDEDESLRARCRLDVDPWMYTSAYTRAWMFAGAITSLLEEGWGPSWWRSPEAGAWLSRAWSRGMAPTAEEVLEEFGLGELSLRPLEGLLRSSLEA